ncbi:WD repeat-containing protein 37 [Hypsibius exemplaris]|uniref:WD repeat-containing protein 37 n=1 Tax=Hypsibius exemplaris TaxID=2072580 RepID=A0A1W0X2F3_HYPEX|nr:WD repeat-containing protein 37 [Hypsibius exemplaris]
MPTSAPSAAAAEKTALRTSLSRPDSFLSQQQPTLGMPTLITVEASPSMPFKFSSAAATSGSDLSKDRLIQLLGSVEDEYDKVIKENAQLKAQIASMSTKAALGADTTSSSAYYNSGGGQASGSAGTSHLLTRSMTGSKSTLGAAAASSQMVPAGGAPDDTHSPPQLSSVDASLHKLKILKEEQLQKFKTSRRKIVSATSAKLRNVPTTEAQMVRSYAKHCDGVWDVAVPRVSNSAASYPYNIMGTVSADRTACVWNVRSGHCLMQYQGHDGAVNSLRFMPNRVSPGDSVLCLTASGDQTAHIWKINSAQLASKDAGNAGAAGEDGDRGGINQDGEGSGAGINHPVRPGKMLVNFPLMVLRSHTNTVTCADWITGGDQVITASSDRSAIVFDVETGDNLNTFAGHDDELTFVSVCRPQKLFLTCSKDATFRLWDLREPNLQSVSVFQGHSDAVNCAVFTPNGDSIVSGGDDKVLRVWDMRNMRAPKASVRMDGGINRISISDSLVVAVPLDNRCVGLYSLPTGKLTRLPRTKREGHQRMVTAATWCDDHPTSTQGSSAGTDVNLLTCGFDRQVLGWKVGLV